jgi:hypothetical protein
VPSKRKKKAQRRQQKQIAKNLAASIIKHETDSRKRLAQIRRECEPAGITELMYSSNPNDRATADAMITKSIAAVNERRAYEQKVAASHHADMIVKSAQRRQAGSSADYWNPEQREIAWRQANGIGGQQ